MSKGDSELRGTSDEQWAVLIQRWNGYSKDARAWLEIRYGKEAAQLAINAIRNL